MAIKDYGNYYKKPSDAFMWLEFGKLHRRLKLSGSAAITLAVREWVAQHKDDPSPPQEVKPNPRALDAPDPFA